MKEFVFIVNTSTFSWTPPVAGLVEICVDQIMVKNNNKIIIHFCLDVFKRLTYCNDNVLPALFSFLCDKNDHVLSYSSPECNHVYIDKPIVFYFVDENNDKIDNNCPILRLKITYVES